MISDFNCSYIALSSSTYLLDFSVKFVFQPIYTDLTYYEKKNNIKIICDTSIFYKTKIECRLLGPSSIMLQLLGFRASSCTHFHPYILHFVSWLNNFKKTNHLKLTQKVRNHKRKTKFDFGFYHFFVLELLHFS